MSYEAIYDNIKAGKYDNQLAYPEGSVKDPIVHEQRLAYSAEQRRLYEEFKQDLFEAYGVVDNPKREKAFDYAWEEGHGSGLHEVLGVFNDIVDLIE